MAAVICIVGASNTGKTTLVEKLVPVLIGRGYLVGSIKHASHGFNIDHEGKDSWRHRLAGSSPTVIFSSDELALVKQIERKPSLRTLVAKYFGEVDVVVAEGFKWEAEKKIVVYREGFSKDLSFPEDEVLAVVGDPSPSFKSVPYFGAEEIGALADHLENTILSDHNKLIKGRIRETVAVGVDIDNP